LKSHILGPDGEKTMCGIVPKDFTPISRTSKDATCKVCLRKAAVAAVEDKHLGGFTEREVAFAAHPLVATNMARAAREVGYSDSFSLSGKCASLREKLWPLISHFQRERAKRFAISKEAIQHQLAAIGFANMLDYIHIDEKTGEVTTKRLDELTREQAAAIQEYKLMPVERIDPETGEVIEVQVLSSIKLFDKRSALVDLGKTIGLFTNNMSLHLPDAGEGKEREDVPLSQLSTDALERIYSIVKQAASTVESAQEDTKALPGQFTVVNDGKG
jgi:phage terminase small subunit